MTLPYFVEQYGGWIGLLLYFLYRDVWPLLSHKLIPAQLKAIQDRRTNDLIQIADERSYRRSVENERLTEIKKIALAIETLSVCMAKTNERIATILTNQQLILARQDNTHNMLVEGIADMRAVTGTPNKQKGEKE